MLRHLSEADRPLSIEADVVVVGAGIAGLILASKLSKAGVNVVVLESGEEQPDTRDHPLNEVECVATPYHGATVGRSRGLGGTSTRWGGALLPFPAADLRERPEVGIPQWPVAYDDIMLHLEEVENLFGLTSSPYEAEMPREVTERGGPDPAFIAREAKWPSFNKRNVATLLRRDFRGYGLDVWLGATVCGFGLDSHSGRVTAVMARGSGPHQLVVSARRFVLAAGAIESTRLLLLLERAGGQVIGRKRLGRPFQDHLSAVLGTIETDDPNTLNHFAGFRFERGTMRSLRFDLSPSARAAAATSAGFVHIAPNPEGPTGFDGVRDLLRSFQRGRPDFRAGLKALSDAPYLSKLLTWRYGHHRLYWPRPSIYEVHCVVEQLAHEDNFITLSDRLDPFGQPLALINWQVREADVRSFRCLAHSFDAFWRAALTSYGNLNWLTAPGKLALEGISSIADIYHPVGTTAMGRNSSEGVVDGNLRVFGIPNLFVAATSTFPSGGTSNPTMMLALFVLRLAEQLKADLRRS